MPAAFFITLEKPINGLKTNLRFPALTAVSHKLETLADKQGVQSHMHFFDSPEETDAILTESEIEVDGPSSYTWYPAADGLAMLQTLRALLKNSASRIVVASADCVNDEIDQMERILEAARQKKVGWCLTVDLDWDQ